MEMRLMGREKIEYILFGLVGQLLDEPDVD
jgi:hypothetical protein